PPLAVNVPVPFVSPKHNNATSPVLANANAAAGCVIFIVAEELHAFASVTFTTIDPTPPFVKLNVVAVVLVVAPAELLVMLNVYGAVPPLTVNVPVPFVSPNHNNATSPVLANANAAAGCVIFIVAEVLHAFASVTFTTIDPTPPFVKLNVVAVVLVVAPAELLVMLNVYGAVPPLAVN